MNESVREILNEFEKVLINTYKADGCVTSAITEIHKNQALTDIYSLLAEGVEDKVHAGVKNNSRWNKKVDGWNECNAAWREMLKTKLGLMPKEGK